MERSEIIPQTSENLGSGRLFYHFSLMTNNINPPNPKFEHQIAFFEVSATFVFLLGTVSDVSHVESLHRAEVRSAER
jgi:hypothetical protein